MYYSALWNKVLEYLKNHCEDIASLPMNARPPVWFHASVEGEYIVIERSIDHANSSVAKPRRLGYQEFRRMLSYYIKKKTAGKRPNGYKDNQNNTYWYAILAKIFPDYSGIPCVFNRENKIFNQWKKYLHSNKQLFIADGIINEAVWNNMPVKILFLMKEANNAVDDAGNEEEWDERDYLYGYNEGSNRSSTVEDTLAWIDGTTMDNVAEDWAALGERIKDLKHKKKLLERICWVNVKKVPGRTTFDTKKFNEYWSHEENRRFLRQQLDLYNPDIVICCGTTGWYKDVYSEVKFKEEMTKRGITYFCNKHTLVVDYYHPEARIINSILHYALCDAVKELRALLRK